MAITTRDGLIAAMASGYPCRINKTGARTTVGAIYFSLFDMAGSPGVGTLAGSSTAAGVVPTDATTGCPDIPAFGVGNTGYISRVGFENSVACKLRLFDMVWKGGAYAVNANVALGSQPSYAGRMPGGSYAGTQIWIETVTSFTGTQTIAVTYTDQTGSGTGHTTGTVSIVSAPTIGRLFQMPLAAGDTGVSKIESVVSTIASAGTFNVLVLRPLWGPGKVQANGGDIHSADKTGLPIVFADSALYAMIATDSTNSQVPDLDIQIVNG